MAGFASVISAVAAAIAALLAGLTLYTSGRRDHRRWLRDSLVDSYVAYLDASFGSAGPGALQARLTGDEGGAASYRKQAAEAHSRQNDTLTRLRILAPANVIKAAEQLGAADRDVTSAALDARFEGDPSWDEVRAEQSSARKAFLNEARRSLELGLGAPISYRTELATGDRE